MTTHATARFDVKGWDEKPYREIDGQGKFTRASVAKTYHGDIEGEGTIEYLMYYREGGLTTYVGLEQIAGTLGGRKGSFVLEHRGTDDGTAATSTWVVVPDSGTGELHSLKGQGGGRAARNDPQFILTLDYEL